MGISGNRKGYKIFSFNTTVRNPVRNVEFLSVFQKYDGQIKTDLLLENYLFDLVKNGVYRFANLSDSVNEKLRNDIELTDSEVQEGFRDNPQKTGFVGRVMTQLRALKDQGFLIFEGTSRKYKIVISKLGHALIDNSDSVTDIYTKSMIGCHSNNPARTSLLNKARPFLNTLFVIAELKKRMNAANQECKGILKHEFAAFVLSMKDCDYLGAVDRIIAYREEFGKNANKDYIENYIYSELDLLPIAYDSLIKEYTDDVFRKFEMTGLLTERGAYKYTYIDFSKYNIEKINSIISYYDDYSFQNFDGLTSYYDFLANIKLPWQQDNETRIRIIKEKAVQLGEEIDCFDNLNAIEQFLDQKYYNEILCRVIDSINILDIEKELLILSGTNNVDNTKYDTIPEALRLEYLLALLIGKAFGKKGLKSNIIYNEEGLPLSFAPSGKADIVFDHCEYPLILEPTMAKNRTQQLNAETTNIVRHMIELKSETGLQYRTMMIAPYVHQDVIRYYKFEAIESNVKIAPLSIDFIVETVYDKKTLTGFCSTFDEFVTYLKNNSAIDYQNMINKKTAVAI